ncbi:MAG: cyclic pyranopterin monophosphate synthase MoaC [Prevotellaceae bacterium]|jgi:cyclic pyranopterin phosphate synthase|nr:cyclic pyranopterin monophosphate synthase MoaC [Prevotellaceae bacterium]
MELSHLNTHGKLQMVDVGNKPPMVRRATAAGSITLQPQTIQKICNGVVVKGDVLAAARMAGIMGAKKTSEVIPLCHPLYIEHIDVEASVRSDGVEVLAKVRSTGATGVEMEALTAVSVALLTIYDMCKAIDKQMVIRDIVLLEKTKEEVNK